MTLYFLYHFICVTRNYTINAEAAASSAVTEVLLLWLNSECWKWRPSITAPWPRIRSFSPAVYDLYDVIVTFKHSRSFFAVSTAALQDICLTCFFDSGLPSPFSVTHTHTNTCGVKAGLRWRCKFYKLCGVILGSRESFKLPFCKWEHIQNCNWVDVFT